MSDNRCRDCKHFRKFKGQRNAIKGSCKLKTNASYTDMRYGYVKACKFYKEVNADDDSD